MTNIGEIYSTIKDLLYKMPSYNIKYITLGIYNNMHKDNMKI